MSGGVKYWKNSSEADNLYLGRACDLGAFNKHHALKLVKELLEGGVAIVQLFSVLVEFI
jgi:hypothetical protein